MSYNANDAEVAAVLRLAGPARYEYSVARIADWKELWSLAQRDNWMLLADEDGTEAFPVWPASAFAAAYAAANSLQHVPAPIPLDEWQHKWTPGLERDRRSVAVFPVPNGLGLVVPVRRLQEDVDAAIVRLED